MKRTTLALSLTSLLAALSGLYRNHQDEVTLRHLLHAQARHCVQTAHEYGHPLTACLSIINRADQAEHTFF